MKHQRPPKVGSSSASLQPFISSFLSFVFIRFSTPRQSAASFRSIHGHPLTHQLSPLSTLQQQLSTLSAFYFASIAPARLLSLFTANSVVFLQARGAALLLHWFPHHLWRHPGVHHLPPSTSWHWFWPADFPWTWSELPSLETRSSRSLLLPVLRLVFWGRRGGAQGLFV